MRLIDLRVIQRLKGGPDGRDGELGALEPSAPEAFEIDSCLRHLWIVDASQGFTVPEALDVMSGIEAYAFLLRVACGLESRIAGETDIFGQLKEAWQRFSETGTELGGDLAPWIQKLFEDAKEIRSLYLRSVGGASYGSLVRKLVGGEQTGATLLIGAGRLGHSVAPFLAGSSAELWIWNRSRERAEALAAECGPGARVLASVEELRQALLSAARAVACVPFDAIVDADRRQAWREGGADRRFVHLGGLRSQAGEWATVEGYVALDELFELARAQDSLRSTQVARARRACEEKAKLRSLGGSSATQHGWEDLAVFAGG